MRRQDLLAANRWNIDEYYRLVTGGYPWCTLVHNEKTDVYTLSLPYGVNSLSIQPIPNKNLDLVNKASESLLADFPDVECEPIDDTEDAESAADMANRFLELDAGEQGTNDAVLFDDRVKLALVTATTYVEGWVDPTGGGYVPLQIKAHPQAVSPESPLVGPDGMPTTDYVLRYVGKGQFVTDPSDADPQWQARIRYNKWQREHVRVFPENVPLDQAEKVVILAHSTIGEAKRRWPEFAELSDQELTALCDWTPPTQPNYLVLLPPFQRARWRLSDGKEQNKAGVSDERIFFYYQVYARATQDHPKGADLVVTGALGQRILHKAPLSVDVEVRGKQEPRCRDIPMVAITPRQDPRGQDPTGLAYIEMAVGATEWNATLAQGFANTIQKNIRRPFVTSSTSPIKGWKVRSAEESGDMLTVIDVSKDMPRQLEPYVLPNSFFQMYNLSDEAINSIMSAERAATGNIDQSREHSGRAISLAIGQNNLGMQSRLNAVNSAYTRWCRIKCQLAMAFFTSPQQMRYVGEDGASKQVEFSATDFALIGRVMLKTGTGTGQSLDAKVQYLGSLVANGFMTKEEAAEAARPLFSKRLAIADSPFEQYVERCVDTWMDGPPPDQPGQTPWAQQYQTWSQYQQTVAQFNAATQAHQQFMTLTAIVNAGAPNAMLGPENQNQQDAIKYQAAVQQLQALLEQTPTAMQPPAPLPPAPPKPWVPFSPRPIDTLPEVAAIWVRKLARTIATVKFGQFGPQWQDVLVQAFNQVRQASAVGSAGSQPSPAGQQPSSPSPKPAQQARPALSGPKPGGQ